MSVHVPAPARLGTVPSAPVAAKAGPVGPGAGPLMTEYLLPTILGTEPQQKMQRALKLGQEVDWVRSAERIISGKVSGCAWHLEDPDENTIDDDWLESTQGDQRAMQAIDLLTKPQAELPLQGPEGVGKRQSRRQQMGITSRHMGLAGQGAWFLDTIDGLGLPHAVLYIRPDRLFPETTPKGVLTGWRLDKKPGDEGMPLPLDQLMLFQIQQPDVGVFAPGLIESSMAKAINNGLIDRHYSTLLASGGRMSGVLAPKEGYISDDNVYNQLVRDWRNITEQPDAARRAQIVRAPVEFMSTVQSVGEMQIIDLMYHNRDALLALWGVPLSMLGGATSSGGLNSGDTRKYDEAALWQGAVHDRLVEFTEQIQSGILDRWEAVMGWAPTLVFEEPAFDDELPNYEKLFKSVSVPMRNSERRAIIGLDPFGDPVLDNRILLPVNVVDYGLAPDPDTGEVPEEPEDEAPEEPTPPPPPPGAAPLGGQVPAVAAPAQPAPGTPPAQKASLTVGHTRRPHDLGARRLRDRMDERITPKVKREVHRVLEEQRDEIASRVEKNWEAIVRHGGSDEQMWWPRGDKEDRRMMDALAGPLAGVAEVVHDHIAEALG